MDGDVVMMSWDEGCLGGFAFLVFDLRFCNHSFKVRVRMQNFIS
jgi:hypothetical protein